MTNVIANAAVLVELNISVWGASKLDKSATKTVIHDNNAVTDAAQVRKNLMAGTNIRKDISDYAAGCRMWHNRQTMPWSDKGSRLLPTSLFLEYKQVANTHKAHFDTLVAKFLTAYPQLVVDAQQRMGSLFDASDYPGIDEVRSKFDFKLVFSPVPDSGNFIVDTSVEGMAEALEEMKDNYDSAFDTRLAAVTREPWERLRKMLEDMSEKMVEETTPRYRVRKGVQQEIKRPYHESFVSNALDMCAMLKHLNITNDPVLDKARLSLESAMFGVDIDVVRESPETRADIKAKVDTILVQNKPEFEKAKKAVADMW